MIWYISSVTGVNDDKSSIHILYFCLVWCVKEYSNFWLYNGCDFGHHHDQRFQVMPVSYLFSNMLDIINDTDNYEVLKKEFLENYKTKK